MAPGAGPAAASPRASPRHAPLTSRPVLPHLQHSNQCWHLTPMGSQKANFGLRSVGVPPDVAVQNHAVSYQRDSSLTPTLPPISPRSYAGTPQSIRSRPPRASRQSTAVVKEEPVQLISWPGFSQHIVHCKGHWKPEGCNAKQDVSISLGLCTRTWL